MMRSRSSEEDDLILPSRRRVKNRGDDCQIRQVGSTGNWRVGQKDVSWVKLTCPSLKLEFDGEGHGSEMDGDEGSIGNEVTCVTEERT